MKIQSLKTRGAIGLKKGMGLDEVELDFSGLSGLVALSGKNGVGKSSCIELLSPYRMLASREGSMRHHFFLRNSYRDLTFDYNNDQYRTLLKIDSESDRTEGFIWKNGESQVNGKVTAYDQYITKLLGSSNLFYNSVFCAQNSGKLSDMTTGQLKSLFVEFLRLDRLSGYEISAKQCVTFLNGKSGQVDRNLESLQDNFKLFADLECQIERAEAERESLVSMLTSVNSEIQDADKQLKTLEEIQTKNTINIERRQDIEKDIHTQGTAQADRYNKHFGELDKLNKVIDVKQKSLTECHDELKNKDAILNASEKANTLSNEISITQKEHDILFVAIEKIYTDERRKSENIEKYQAEIKEIEDDKKLTDIYNEIDLIRNSLNELNVTISNLKSERENIDISFELIQLNSQIKACKDSMSLLDRRDPLCMSSTCSFIVSAVKAEKKLPELKAEKQAIMDDISKRTRELKQLIETKKETHGVLSEKLEFASKKYNDLKLINDTEIVFIKSKMEISERERSNIRGHVQKDLKTERKKLSFKLDKLTEYLKKTNELAGRLQDIERTEWMEAVLTSDIKGLQRQIEDKKAVYSKSDVGHRSAVHRLEKKLEDINALIDMTVPEKITETKKLLASKQTEKDSFNKKISESNEWGAILNERVDKKADLEKKIASAQGELSMVKRESSQWLYLQTACGKNGLQALEIDGVAPLVTGYANDLLTSSFGPGFSVKIVTQDPETGKETFDIMAIRPDGSETSFKKLSGGEKVWILKAIRLGMTLISKEKSGRNFQTIIADEEDGPLDTEKAQAFIGLYRSILEVGGFGTCFYISHNPDVVSMADHQIEFTEKGIRIN